MNIATQTLVRIDNIRLYVPNHTEYKQIQFTLCRIVLFISNIVLIGFFFQKINIINAMDDFIPEE